MTDHKPLPVSGYTAQSQETIDLVNEGKQIEERVLRYIDKLKAAETSVGPVGKPTHDPCCLATGTTYIQTGFMWVFRSVFNPQRTKLPEDTQ